VQINCYLCKGAKILTRRGAVRDRGDLAVLECASCGLVFLSDFGHISPEHYANSGMFGDRPPSPEDQIRDARVDDDRRFSCLAPLITNKSVLDFGCGAGGFVKRAQTVASRVVGVEPERRLLEHLSAALEVYPGLDQLEERGTLFQVICGFHVVEHLVDPRSTLQRLAALMTSDGRLVIEVPSAEDALITLYDCEAFQRFTYWSQHLFLFSSSTLRTLAAQAGLRTVAIGSVQRYPLSNHLGWILYGKPGGHRELGFLDTEDLNRAYAAALAGLGKTDTLIGYFEHG